MGFQVEWYDIYRPARLGYCSLCRTTLGPDINATYFTPAEGRGFQTNNSQLAPTCRRVSLSTCAFLFLFSLLIPLASSGIYLFDSSLDSHIELAGVVLLLISILLPSS